MGYGVIGYISFLIVIIIFAEAVAYYYHTVALKNVSVKRYFSKNRVYEGDELEVIYEIENRKRLPLINLQVTDELTENLKVITGSIYEHTNTFNINVLGFRKKVRVYKVIACERDYISRSIVYLKIKDIFGLGVKEEQFTSYDNIYIYPKPKELKLNFDNMVIQSRDPIKRWLEEDPLSFYSIREYNSNDSMRKINWMKTAQFNKLMVNEYETNKTKKIIIFMNLVGGKYNFMSFNSPHFEDLIKFAVYMSKLFLKRGYELGILTNCGMKIDEKNYLKIEPGMGENQYKKICDRMTVVDYRNVLSYQKIVKENHGMLKDGKIIILSIENEYAHQLLRYLNGKSLDAKLLAAITDSRADYIDGGKSNMSRDA